MKKILSFFFALVLTVSTVQAQWFVGAKDVVDDVVLKFGVISDTHFENNIGDGAKVKVPQALKNLTGHGPFDALFIVGDVTNDGSQIQYDLVTEAFKNDDNFNTYVKQCVFMAGNHDVAFNFQKGLAPFVEAEEYPLDQYLEIGGFPFIVVSYRESPQEAAAQLQKWLEKAAADYPEKPIFVFTHVPPTSTVNGSWSTTIGAYNQILNQYPQVIVFSGHTHYPIGDPRSIHQGVNPESSRANYYTVINTGSTTYAAIESGKVDERTHPRFYENVTEGLIVSVKQNGNVLVQRYDTYRDEEIGADNRWLIEAPHDGSKFKYADIRDAKDATNDQFFRTGLPAPEWADDNQEASTEFDDTKNILSVTFPQAIDEEYIFRYEAKLCNMYGRIVSTKRIYSYAFLNSQAPETLTVDFDCNGLASDQYEVWITAHDAYENVSENFLIVLVELQISKNGNAILNSAAANWTFNDSENVLKNSVENSGFVMQAAKMNGQGSMPDICTTIEEAGMSIVDGTDDSDMALQIPKNSGIKVTHNQPANITTYTIIFDMMYTSDDWVSLIQTQTGNAGTADLYIDGANHAIGKDGWYGGHCNSNKWHRIAFVVKDGVPTAYLDGEKTGSTGYHLQYVLKPDCFFLFLDEKLNGKDSEVIVSNISFWLEALTDGQIANIGKIE